MTTGLIQSHMHPNEEVHYLTQMEIDGLDSLQNQENTTQFEEENEMDDSYIQENQENIFQSEDEIERDASHINQNEENINTSIDVPQQSCKKFILDDGSVVWVPVVESKLIPNIGTRFKGYDDGLKWYKQYAARSGFDVRRATERKTSGVTVAKYFTCNRYGLPHTAPSDTLKPKGDKQVRNITLQRTNCKAFVAFKIVPGTQDVFLWRFEQQHNHEFINKDSMFLSRANRQLTFFDQYFIHKMSSAKIGATVAHRLMCTIKGGYDYGGTEVDYKNFMRDMNCYVDGSDANLLIQKLQTRLENVSNFTYEKRCDNRQLNGLFWADDTSKLNYKQFGDVVSFDATYRTNRYCMVFVPFTGIDNHKRCVTFGAGLLCREDTESYVWLLNAFQKQPLMVLTDQDGAMTNAIAQVFPQSRHRYCMWHISSKLPVKVSWNIMNTTPFKKEFNSLVWDNNISEKEFEERWCALMIKYKLTDNSWMNLMFSNRTTWVSAYFKHVPMSGLMRTTSLSESENSAFNRTSHHGYTLNNFMNSFESAMEKQRHNQIKADFSTTNSVPIFKTPLIHLEKHAYNVYTRRIFLTIQHEILHSLLSCAQQSVTVHLDSHICLVKEKKFVTDPKQDTDVHYQMNPHAVDGEFEVVLNKQEMKIKCECLLFEQYGILCRHAFCVLKVNHVNEIPSAYILDRWKRDLIPIEMLKRRFKYGESSENVDKVAYKAFSLVEHSLSMLRNDENKLQEYISKLESMKLEIEGESGESQAQSKKATIQQFYGASTSESVEIENPGPVRNKGCGTGKRLKSVVEKATVQSQKKSRTCKTCGVQGHNSRSCLTLKTMANQYNA